MIIRIVICVEGKVVRNIYADGDPDQYDVELVDLDNLEVDGMDRVEREAVLDNVTAGMNAIF